ncbi:hypothetical protein PMZ76_22675, partial [[Clostridium] symbiosum]|uniref:hypothetical protein n=2 Tax=Clostridium symbiosum TaxID=1512 RepID=UPI00232B7AFC
PGTKDSYTHPTTPSAGRTGGVLTCLTKSPNVLVTAPRLISYGPYIANSKIRVKRLYYSIHDDRMK